MPHHSAVAKANRAAAQSRTTNRRQKRKNGLEMKTRLATAGSRRTRQCAPTRQPQQWAVNQPSSPWTKYMEMHFIDAAWTGRVTPAFVSREPVARLVDG